MPIERVERMDTRQGITTLKFKYCKSEDWLLLDIDQIKEEEDSDDKSQCQS